MNPGATTNQKGKEKGKVLLAMSGGVDSSVAAALLLEEGYEVIGCFMRLGTVGESLEEDAAGQACNAQADGDAGIGQTQTQTQTQTKISHRGCCSVSDAADARFVAASLGIPFYVCNFKKDFGRIIDYFTNAYAQGQTPNPCVRCNDWLKFGKLANYAKQLGCAFVASGHYARLVHDKNTGTPMLARGIDTDKDQSYVLFGVPLAQLAHMLLPIGNMHKSAVRAKAKALNLPVFDKPDSQEICFVPDDDYAGLVERRLPEIRADRAGTGRIVDTQGNTLGTHEGQHRYTIGQRRHVGVALGYPIYVVEKDPQTNTITVGSKEDLLVDACTVSEANWLTSAPFCVTNREDGIENGSQNGISDDPDSEADSVQCFAQYRAHGRCVPVRVRLLPESQTPGPSGRSGRFEVRFCSPQEAPAAGQALVLYDHDHRVLGGGWIERTHRRISP